MKTAILNCEYCGSKLRLVLPAGSRQRRFECPACKAIHRISRSVFESAGDPELEGIRDEISADGISDEAERDPDVPGALDSEVEKENAEITVAVVEVEIAPEVAEDEDEEFVPTGDDMEEIVPAGDEQPLNFADTSDRVPTTSEKPSEEPESDVPSYDPSRSPSEGTMHFVTAALSAEHVAITPRVTKKVRDAIYYKQDGNQVFRFTYATVNIRSAKYDSIGDAVEKVKDFETTPQKIAGKDAAFKFIVLRPDGPPEPSEAIVRILMQENDGTLVGKTERDSIYGEILDFGEHHVAISHAGISIAGNVEEDQLQKYFYYIAQIGAAIARYHYNERTLTEVMVDIRERAADFDIERLQAINISTSKAMLDISDELLDIPARESYVLNKLISVANIDVYENRITRMLEIIQHHVAHKHALTAKRSSARIEFVIYVMGVIAGFCGFAEVFQAADVIFEDAHTYAIFGGFGMIAIILCFATLASYLYYRNRKGALHAGIAHKKKNHLMTNLASFDHQKDHPLAQSDNHKKIG
ncbi:MAG: zinc ribbon domain-containing protein [Planctomycetes bacterium]|nr:zinc ribbon domain-containing protein [Planctomycetota bacterium]